MYFPVVNSCNNHTPADKSTHPLGGGKRPGFASNMLCTASLTPRLLLYPAKSAYGGTLHESTSVFACEWLCLRRFGTYSGGASPCTHNVFDGVAYVRSRHKGRTAETEWSQPHLASGGPDA